MSFKKINRMHFCISCYNVMFIPKQTKKTFLSLKLTEKWLFQNLPVPVDHPVWTNCTDFHTHSQTLYLLSLFSKPVVMNLYESVKWTVLSHTVVGVWRANSHMRSPYFLSPAPTPTCACDGQCLSVRAMRHTAAAASMDSPSHGVVLIKCESLASQSSRRQ